ncbi:MAG: hypothetical protein EXS05_09605 [Planctomycetaceae bacterium]|nr:hypothetical protein [Planctomycetaceae bacterium]
MIGQAVRPVRIVAFVVDDYVNSPLGTRCRRLAALSQRAADDVTPVGLLSRKSNQSSHSRIDPLNRVFPVPSTTRT